MAISEEDRLLSTQDLVDMFPGTTKNSWTQRRRTGDSPRWIRIGNRVFHTREAVAEWLRKKEAQTHNEPIPEVA